VRECAKVSRKCLLIAGYSAAGALDLLLWQQRGGMLTLGSPGCLIKEIFIRRALQRTLVWLCLFTVEIATGFQEVRLICQQQPLLQTTHPWPSERPGISRA
jgi:hypothetical protein